MTRGRELDREIDQAIGQAIAAPAREGMLPVGATVILAGKSFRVVHAGQHSMTLVGARGARYALQQNVHRPDLFALVDNSMRPRSRWFRRTPDGFEPVEV